MRSGTSSRHAVPVSPPQDNKKPAPHWGGIQPAVPPNFVAPGPATARHALIVRGNGRSPDRARHRMVCSPTSSPVVFPAGLATWALSQRPTLSGASRAGTRPDHSYSVSTRILYVVRIEVARSKFWLNSSIIYNANIPGRSSPAGTSVASQPLARRPRAWRTNQTRL